MSRVVAGGSAGSLYTFVRPEESVSASEASSVLASVGPIGPILASEPSSSVPFVGHVVASEYRSALASAVPDDQVSASGRSSQFTTVAPVNIDLNPTTLSESIIDLVNNSEIRNGSKTNTETNPMSKSAIITVDFGANTIVI